MKKKTIAGLITVAVIAAVVMFAGCIEEETPTKAPEIPSLPEQPIVTPTQPTIPTPTTQNINGNYKVQDVSGDTININGNYNKIRILNADVSLIRVNGNYNTVYYPKEARPTIKENGFGNEIKTY
jgi:PBP1b-binding outer membrane lipoprotein LpoB